MSLAIKKKINQIGATQIFRHLRLGRVLIIRVTIVVKSDKPAEFISTHHILSYQEIPGYSKATIYSDTNTDLYDLTKLDEYTFRIIVKPFVDNGQLTFIFGSQENPNARPGVVIITCGYPMDDRTKEYFEKYYSW